MADRAPACLTDSEMQVLGEAPPGAAPVNLAQHVAGCKRCQERLLFGAERRARAARRRAAVLPSRRRAAVLLVCLLGMLAIAVWSLSLLAG